MEIPESFVEGVSNFLIEQGSPGVVQERASRLSGGKRERIVAYFPNNRSFSSKEKKVRTYLSSLDKVEQSFSLQHQVIREEKWAEAWKSHFKPFHATPRIVIKPPWEDYPRKRGEILIEIDPGMAFGTGTHPSTRMCLQALEELIPLFPQGCAILDVGTGSGILAIAARKLKASKILAVDIDPVAIDCARKNVAANQVSGGIDFRVASPESLRGVFDIVVANLLPQEILKLTLPLSKRVNSRGALIVSGILRGQKREIAASFAGEGMDAWRSRELKGWACLILKKKAGFRE